MLVAALLFTLASSSPSAVAPTLIPGPVVMSPKQIREYNAHLAKDHPNYIRCERVEETGSLARKKRICRTNEEWRRIEDGGNRDAREAVEGLQKGWSNGET